MKNTKRRGNLHIKNKNLIIVIILITIIMTVLCTRVAFSKYKTSIKFNKNLEIATPIFIVEGTETSKISAINNIGYYEFVIKNYNETQVSETGFLYTIEIISNTDESIKFELYKDDEQVELENLKTSNLTINGNEQIEQKYKLKVIYDKNLGTNGKDILEDVQIKVHSEQEKIG